MEDEKLKVEMKRKCLRWHLKETGVAQKAQKELEELLRIAQEELKADRDSDWARDSATSQSVEGYHCDAQDVTMCTPSLKQTAISLSS